MVDRNLGQKNQIIVRESFSKTEFHFGNVYVHTKMISQRCEYSLNSGLKPVSEKLRFLDVKLAWTIGLTVEVKPLRFEIPSA